MRALSVIAALLLGACATVTQSTYEAIPGAQKKIANSVNTAASFDAVWDAVVAKLSQSFFVINNIDKQSRIINVSFTSTTPEDYVDCGASRREFDFQNERRTYEYQVAASNSYKFATTWVPAGGVVPLPAVYKINRSTELDGRANIYIAPGADGAGSIVSVNAIYVWGVTLSGTADAYNAFGALVSSGQRMTPETPPGVNFTTQAPGSSGAGVEKITCATNGKFEESILNFVPRQ